MRKLFEKLVEYRCIHDGRHEQAKEIIAEFEAPVVEDAVAPEVAPAADVVAPVTDAAPAV